MSSSSTHYQKAHHTPTTMSSPRSSTSSPKHPSLPPRSPLDQYWSPTGPLGLATRTALRTTQFLLAITAAGLYGHDLAAHTAARTHAPTNWVYACVVAALSAITCIIHCFVTIKRVAWCVWDFVLAVLWAAAFGVFVDVVWGGGEEGVRVDTARMKAGVVVDCVGMVVWCLSAGMGCVWCCAARRVTRRTDRLIEREEGEGDVEMGTEAERRK